MRRQACHFDSGGCDADAGYLIRRCRSTTLLTELSQPKLRTALASRRKEMAASTFRACQVRSRDCRFLLALRQAPNFTVKAEFVAQAVLDPDLLAVCDAPFIPSVFLNGLREHVSSFENMCVAVSKSCWHSRLDHGSTAIAQACTPTCIHAYLNVSPAHAAAPPACVNATVESGFGAQVCAVKGATWSRLSAIRHAGVPSRPRAPWRWRAQLLRNRVQCGSAVQAAEQ